MSSATRHQSLKSLDFTPWIGYFLKNGIILSMMSANFVTINSAHVLFLNTRPQSKNLIRLFSKFKSF